MQSNPRDTGLIGALRRVSDIDHVQICQAAADEIERRDIWQPIASAPMLPDGTYYLLGFFGSRPDGFPPAQVGLWDGEQWSGDWCLVGEGNFDPGYESCQPTHWMQLPDSQGLTISTQ
jgi:hypothetical protein